MKQIDLWHNIMWSRYKAGVFTELYRACVERGDQLRVLHIAETDQNRADLAPVVPALHEYPYEVLYRGSYGSTNLVRRLMKVARRAASSHADIVIISGFDTLESWVLRLMTLFKGQKAVVTCDSTILDKKQRLVATVLKRLFMSGIDGVFCYGSRAAEYARYLGVPDDRIHVRSQAAYLPPDYDASRIMVARREARVRNARPRLLYVGRLSSEKGLKPLLRAHAALIENAPGTILVLVGRGSEEEDLRTLTEELGTSESVHFLGALSDQKLDCEYLQASALVLPSESEPWGLVVNEALARGCPVLVSDRCGCVPELVVDGFNGFSFKFGDEIDLVRKLKAVLDLSDYDPTENCLSTVAPFTSRRAAAEMALGIERVLGQRHSGL